MHIHASALSGLIAFLLVLLFATLWRTAQGYVETVNPALAGAMAYQLG